MGTAIVRRIAAGRTIILGDISEANLEKTAKDLTYSGYDVKTCVVDATDEDSIKNFAKEAAALGPVKYFIDTAGASPSQASPEHILKLDMVGYGYAVEPLGALVMILAAGLLLPLLPYCLSFAAGAMLYVVVEELIPEMAEGSHSNIGTVAFAIGCAAMMALDVGLG